MIRLDCPQCHTELELDEAFLGGICRCSSCGSMITVPRDIQAGANTILKPKHQSAPAQAEYQDEVEEAFDFDMDPAPVRRSGSTGGGRKSSSATMSSKRSSASRGSSKRKKGPGMMLPMIVGSVITVGVIAGIAVKAARSSKKSERVRLPYQDRPSLTMDDYRRAIPEADDTFLMIQMNKDATIEQALDDWGRKQSRNR